MNNKKNSLRKVCLLLALPFALIACNKEGADDGIGNNSSIIEAKNVGGDDYSRVATVAVFCNDCDNEIIATADFKNGGFKLKLPKTVSEEALSTVEYHGMGSVASDMNAKITEFDEMLILAFDAKGDDVGEFGLEAVDTSWYVNYVYADRKFTLKGDDCDCTFKKGWNILYLNAREITTTKPSGVTFKWFYSNHDF